MTQMTEKMRRELRIAATVASHQGHDYKDLDEEGRHHCHVIARAVMPGVNALIADERINAQREFFDQLKESNRKAARGAYEDGFEDGQKNDYNNRWADKAGEPVWDMDQLMG